MWSKKVKMNKDKLDNLESEKKTLESQLSQYFEELNKITTSLNNSQELMEKLK